MRMSRLRTLPKRLLAQARLLRRDPEQFARNLSQFTHPALFERRLVDIVHPTPMRASYSPDGQAAPRLNVLDTAWTTTGMTGGPNTVINLVCRIARHGIPVRLVSTVDPASIDPAWFHFHASGLLGTTEFPAIEIVSAGNPARPLALGPGDLFLVTHWSTAQQLKPVLPQLPPRPFFYMLQEFEPGFYAWSSNYALALETYGLDFWPIINEQVLADFLLAQPFGRLADPVTRDRALVFEPAVDATLFHPAPHPQPPRARRLLFYARPTNARNMFGLGLAALREAAADPAFAGWEFLSIGSRGSLPDLPLPGGHTLRPAPWQGYTGYGDTLRAADILLCPMLSPHTSYPVLEMAACGGLAVTNSFANKSAAFLHSLSANIIATDPTVEAFATGLLEAARRTGTGQGRTASLNMPRDWATTLDPVAHRVAEICRELSTSVVDAA